MASLVLPSYPSQLTVEIVGALKICPEIAFSDHKGKRKSGIEKRSRKLLEKLEAPLTKFLEPDETILSIFRAQCHVNGLQQYTMGIFVHYLTAAVVVITDRRLVQLRTSYANSWDQGIRVCNWEHVAQVKVTGFLGKALILYFADGKKHRVWKLPGAEAKVLKRFLPELVRIRNLGSSRPGSVTSLCPECRSPLMERNYECQQCRLLFKNEKKMRWLALAPGAAYFYCGKILMGVMDMLGEGFVLLFFGIFAISVLLGTNSDPVEKEGTWVTFVFILFLLAIEIAVTIHHCQFFIRDFIPTKQHVQGPEQSFAASAGFPG